MTNILMCVYRNWFALFVRTGQKRKGEVSSNALQQLRDELVQKLQAILLVTKDENLPDGYVVQASALLRVYCALRGIAAIKYDWIYTVKCFSI